jgi:glycosyltransferase involved in cell wall biosynthesis
MKNILFIGTLTEKHCKDGYTNAGNGLLSVLLEMKKRKLIKNIEAVNLANIYQNQIIMQKYDIVILVMNPFFLNNQGNQEILKSLKTHTKKIFLQIVWETDPLPSYWNWMWNSDIFDGFITPSRFVEQLLKNKTKKDIFYIPHYIDTSQFSQIDIEKKVNEKIFTVLTIGQWTKRKGLEEAIAGFSRALSIFPDCRLIVKYSGMKDINSLDIEAQVRNIIIMNSPKISSPIYVSNEEASIEELIDLYQNSSLLLFPSRGEGFGLPVAEAMSVGIPVLYTGWSSLPEVAIAKGNLPIKYLLDESIGMSQFGYEKGSKYAVPFMTHMIQLLEYKYFLWKEDKAKYFEETFENYKVIEERFGKEAIIKYLLEFVNHDNSGETL